MGQEDQRLHSRPQDPAHRSSVGPRAGGIAAIPAVWKAGPTDSARMQVAPARPKLVWRQDTIAQDTITEDTTAQDTAEEALMFENVTICDGSLALSTPPEVDALEAQL